MISEKRILEVTLGSKGAPDRLHKGAFGGESTLTVASRLVDVRRGMLFTGRANARAALHEACWPTLFGGHVEAACRC